MPTYTFRCPKCNELLDKFYKMSEIGQPKCPKCDEPMNKLLSSPPFKFTNKRGTMGHIGSPTVPVGEE